MRTISLVSCAVLLSCVPDEPSNQLGGQSGSLKEELPLPEDVATLDYAGAARDALALALNADVARAWRAHESLLADSDGTCPTLFLGAPEDAMFGDEDGMSWVGRCSAGPLRFTGAAAWSNVFDEGGGGASRSFGADATILDDGDEAFAMDGEGTDSVSWLEGGGFTYSSDFEGTLRGRRVFDPASGLDGGFRGEVSVAYTDRGGFDVSARLYLLGEPLHGRFDAVLLDITFQDGCAEEPVGHIGLRGVDGYWFDVYFLPRYAPDDPSAVAQAYPYELIPNPTCDGCGDLFVRNVQIEDAAPVCPDFGGLLNDLTAPTPDEYVFTLHEFPWERE